MRWGPCGAAQNQKQIIFETGRSAGTARHLGGSPSESPDSFTTRLSGVCPLHPPPVGATKANWPELGKLNA